MHATHEYRFEKTAPGRYTVWLVSVATGFRVEPCGEYSTRRGAKAAIRRAYAARARVAAERRAALAAFDAEFLQGGK